MKTNNPHQDHDHEKCKQFFAKLSEYIDNELNDMTYKQINDHIKDCDCCKGCITTLKKTVELSSHMDDRPVPEHVSDKLKKMASNMITV